MAGNNPYAVRPAVLDASPLMAGIGGLIKESRANQKSEKLKAGLMQAYQSGDPDAVAEFMSGNPDASDTLTGMLNFRNDKTGGNYNESLRTFLSNPTRENLEEQIKSRSSFVRGEGGDPSDTEQALSQFDEDSTGFIKSAEMALASRDEKGYKAYKGDQATNLKSGVKVQSSTQLPGGLVQIVMTDGEVRTVTPSQADELAIKEAERRGAELQGLRSSERTAGSEAQKLATKSYNKLNQAKRANQNINKAIKLIDDGAESGVIKSKLPSIRSASVKLDNLQNQLGLDVIGNTTFGALSESELAFALSTAMPKNLEPQELRKWLVEKNVAQQKLMNYLDDAVSFLGTPGNTVADWNNAQREMSSNEEQSQVSVPLDQQATPEGATATNPQTGQKAVYINGNWQPAP